MKGVGEFGEGVGGWGFGVRGGLFVDLLCRGWGGWWVKGLERGGEVLDGGVSEKFWRGEGWKW